MFNDVLGQQEAEETSRQELADVQRQVQSQVIAVSNSVSKMASAHQNSMLQEDADMVEDTVKARNTSVKSIGEFIKNIGILETAFSHTKLFKTESEESTEAKRLGNVVRRSVKTLGQMFNGVKDSNIRTIKMIKEEEFEDATSNFIYEEAARVSELQAQLAKIRGNLNKLVAIVEESERNRIGHERDEIKAQLSSTGIQTYTISGVISLALIAIAVMFSVKGLANPLGRLTALMGRLAKGGETTTWVNTSFNSTNSSKTNTMRCF